MDDSAESLRAAGRLLEAAAAYRKRGDLSQAEALYAELWDFAAAAAVARERGDRPAELGHLLSAQDLPAATAMGAAIEAGTDVEVRRAAEIYERHRRWLEAAALRERLGELADACALYRKGQALLDVARIERGRGHLREAGLAYEQLIAREPDGAEGLRARLELGQLLLLLQRPEEGCAQLQAALLLAQGAIRLAVLEELIIALSQLGYDDAADELFLELGGLAGDTPPLRELKARHRPIASAGPTRLAGRYELDRLLGAGASGRVYLARDSMTGRAVAVKSLTPPIEKRAQQSWLRFFSEVRLVASLRHPNVVEILDVDEASGLIVMEYVSGGTLFERLRAAPQGLPQAAVRQLMLDVLDALSAVHARAIVHRDLKPANLFYTATGQIKVGDFGSAHLFADEATQTAGFIGTLAYMAPEQMSANQVSFAADLYALGVVAFQALTGRLPFLGPDFVSQHLGDAPPAPSALRSGLAPAWDRVIAAVLAKDPARRPASIDALRREVERISVVDEERRTQVVVEQALAPATKSARYVRASDLASGAAGAISLGLDTKLGRQVIIETLPAAYLASEAGARHLAWLRALGRLGGPRIQRLFALERREDDGIDAIFDAIHEATRGDASIDPRARQLLERSLRPLHQAGVAHGSLARSILLEARGPSILIAGRAPRADATIADDLAALG